MAALRNLTSLLPFVCSVLALAAGAAAHGQGQTGEPAFKDVRIHPDSIRYQPRGSDSTIAPSPPVMTIASPPATAATSAQQKRELEILPDPQSTASMIEAVGVCVKVVKPGFELDLSQLVDNSWGYTRPVKMQNALGQFQKVDYIKDNLTISLQDFSDKILCRAVGMIGDQQQFSEIRKALTETLGATAISETPGYELAAKFMADRQPNGSINNAYILGEHVIEIASVEQDLSKSGIVGAGVETMALLTSSPTASNFRKLNETLRNK